MSWVTRDFSTESPLRASPGQPGLLRRRQPELKKDAFVTMLLGNRTKEKPSPDAMSLNEHLGELRRRVIVCVLAFLAAAIAATVLYEPILHLLIRPLCEVDSTRVGHGASALGSSGGNCNLYVTSPLDGLSLRVKIAVFGGLFMASPGHPVPGLAVHHPRLEVAGEEVRRTIRGSGFRPVPARCGHGLFHAAPCTRVLEVGGWAQPAVHLRSHPLFGVDLADDGAVRADISVPGDPGVTASWPEW